MGPAQQFGTDAIFGCAWHMASACVMPLCWDGF